MTINATNVADATTVAAEFKFESETCSRCCGSGKYSYCQMYGDRCFKCGGRGIVLTKRGSIAKDYYESLCSKPASELKKGDGIWVSHSRKFFPIKENPEWTTKHGCSIVNGEKVPCFVIVTDAVVMQGGDTTIYRVRQSPEELLAKRAQAMTYQASLTKAGKPRKK